MWQISFDNFTLDKKLVNIWVKVWRRHERMLQLSATGIELWIELRPRQPKDVNIGRLSTPIYDLKIDHWGNTLITHSTTGEIIVNWKAEQRYCWVNKACIIVQCISRIYRQCIHSKTRLIAFDFNRFGSDVYRKFSLWPENILVFNF